MKYMNVQLTISVRDAEDEGESIHRVADSVVIDAPLASAFRSMNFQTMANNLLRQVYLHYEDETGDEIDDAGEEKK
jgi:hypothetical protein